MWEREALLDERVVELFEVLGLEPVEPLSPEVRRDVHADHRLVALQRPRSYAAGCDVRQPVGEPRFDGVAVDRGYRAGLAPHLELADLPDDLVASLRGPVPSVRLAVGTGANGDPPVPAAVGGPEDAGFSR
jgi:hypothetical protein